ncbi:MAG: hypothetical protein HOW73_09715 [Polyangiaceae bacterium]|nr:hypothetical protein [Polyangiaceae bacterium]
MAFVRRFSALALLVLAALPFGAMPSVAVAKNRFALEPPNVEEKRAFKYAAMSNEACFKELDKRKFPYKVEGETKQVEAPLRFTGPVRGVTYKLSQRAEKDPDKTSPAAIADCRLALAIDDFSRVLAKHDIVEVEYLSMYRTRGVGFVKPGKRHPSGRAIDVATMKRKDGTVFSVYKDWHGRPGSQTCGAGAAKPTKDTEGAKVMRAIVCETAGVGPFNLMLTPHYDWGHKDHFHLEVRSDIRWFLIQ